MNLLTRRGQVKHIYVIQENKYEYVVCKMADILHRPQYVIVLLWELSYSPRKMIYKPIHIQFAPNYICKHTHHIREIAWEPIVSWLKTGRVRSKICELSCFVLYIY